MRSSGLPATLRLPVAGPVVSVAALALEARGSFAFSRADYAQSVRDYHNAYQTGLVRPDAPS